MENWTVQRHNAIVLAQLEEGDVVKYDRGVYSHYAIYAGEGEVVHLAGLPDDEHVGSNSTQMFSISGVSYNKARVCVESFFKVAQGSRAFKNNYKDKDHSTFSPPEIVKRAKSKIGRVSYNVLWSNCEHFATWCRYNVGTSEQTENFLTRAAVVGTLGAVAAVGLAWWYGGEKTSESEQTRDKKGRKERK